MRSFLWPFLYFISFLIIDPMTERRDPRMADRLADRLWLKDHGQTPKLSKAEKAKTIKSTQNKTITYKTFALNKSIIPVTGSGGTKLMPKEKDKE